MILTVTLNTALDVTYHVPRMRAHASHRVSDVIERPGGKGVNVARVLAALGHEVTATGFAGGPVGAVLRSSLAGSPGVRDALVPCAGNTRRTLAVVDETTGDTTQFNEAGPVVTAAEWAAFQARYEELLAGGVRAVALCGSLPPGVPVGAYATLIRTARAAGAAVLLDTSGEPLRRGVAARPDIVKPNAAELAQLTGSREPLPATLAARRRGAHAVVTSLGPAGLLAATPHGIWQAAPPAPMSGNPTGAGDSAVAALLSGLAHDQDWPTRLTHAVALSAATVKAPAAGEFDAGTYELLRETVRVTAG
ncbi:1-phosphofructokinase family hexose kinase [Streptomyces bambusae]|uniref:1-phosphofructokinase family hexose kinase n=1 Tax=Streptomyces bambusae TaxID=1550616 RepID=UPI001CFE7530|nr:1-phosphofructokinase family hexose kinase [Streptomyces bambusae]MCB5166144.1 1-phosphofructokinase family hexose kinase [Streptomyces bambusae]